MELGAFSVSLAVKDIKASKAFYEKLGFEDFMGDISRNWLILKNGEHVIGLFQGMFERNSLTFNPGWDSNARKLDTFTDVRELQKQLKAQGVELMSTAKGAPRRWPMPGPSGSRVRPCLPGRATSTSRPGLGRGCRSSNGVTTPISALPAPADCTMSFCPHPCRGHG
jgi:lactoylglutathione lyase